MAAQNQFADWYNEIPQMTKDWNFNGWPWDIPDPFLTGTPDYVEGYYRQDEHLTGRQNKIFPIQYIFFFYFIEITLHIDVIIIQDS